MSYGKIRVLLGTLRVRLTLWNTAVLLVLVTCTLLGVREGLRILLLDSLDEFLQEEIAEIQDDIREQLPRWNNIQAGLANKAQDHPRRRLFVQLFSPSGTLLWSSAQTPDEGWNARLFGAPAGKTLVLEGYRVVEQPCEDAHVIIRVGVSTQRPARDLAQFTRAMLIIGCVVLIVTPVVGYLLAGRATQPISEIIDTTARLQPAQLDERLPVRGTQDELDRLSQTINGLLDRIARYLDQNRSFTAHAAHELRTPLAAIQTSLEVALLGDRTVDEYKEELLGLLEELNHLRLLVNQLLILAEGDAGQLCTVREQTRLDQTVQKAMDMFQAVAEVKDVQLTREQFDPVVLHADTAALRQVINNLLDNAIKHTPSGGRVSVRLCYEGQTGECVLSIRDTGIGIAPTDLPHIFERFYRANKARARDRRHDGTGLGLSLCRTIVEAHGGTITAQSSPGEGAIFTVHLPGACPPPTPA